MNIQETLKQTIASILDKTYGITDAKIDLTATRSEFAGDVTLMVFPFVKAARKAPEATAAEIGEALKTAAFTSALFNLLGFETTPASGEIRHDIIQAVELGSAEGMIAFCKGIQAAAPVDSFATPIPGDMPGYDSQVIMAAGAFVQGSTMELSADGPIREPYAVYFQGGLTWYHAKLGILMSLQKMVDAGLVTL